jgi:hypothetical protein
MGWVMKANSWSRDLPYGTVTWKDFSQTEIVRKLENPLTSKDL